MVAERETIRPPDRPPHGRARRRDPSPDASRGVTKSGLFVKLAQTGADGFIPAATIGQELPATTKARRARRRPHRREPSGSATRSRGEARRGRAVAGALRFLRSSRRAARARPRAPAPAGRGASGLRRRRRALEGPKRGSGMRRKVRERPKEDEGQGETQAVTAPAVGGGVPTPAPQPPSPRREVGREAGPGGGESVFGHPRPRSPVRPISSRHSVNGRRRP